MRDVKDISQSLDFVLSPEHLELPESVLKQAQTAVKEIYAYAHQADRVSRLMTDLNAHEKHILSHLQNIKYSSVLMAYDFHYEPETQQLSLIEINTNGAGFLLAEILYRSRSNTRALAWPTALENLKKSFFHEVSTQNIKKLSTALILDEAPSQQKMYFEFLMYKKLFESWGWPTQICDLNEAVIQLQKTRHAFVYNRYTDFLFTKPSSQYFLETYLSGQTIFSPSPHEYLLMADKNRLIEFSEQKVSDVCIPTLRLNANIDIDQVWRDRKKYVFKPTQLHGSKGVYRGSSISNKMFREIIGQDYIAQEYRPPGQHGEWKFDLRFYVYQNEIHLGIARLYQGQVTNFRTLGGGFTTLSFT